MKHEIDDVLDQVDAGQIDQRWSSLSVESRRLMDEHLARGQH